MGYLIQQSSTARALVFLMVDSTDHVSGKTGLSPTVTIRKEGGSFAAPSGAVTEIANGWYQVAANATDSNTLGSLLLHASATGADPVDDRFEVVKFNPDDNVRLGLTALPNAAADAAGGLAISDAGGLDLDTLLGRLDAAISTRLAAASYTAPLDAAGTRAALGMSAADLDTQLDAIAAFIDTEIAAIKAKTDNLPPDPADASDIAALFTAIQAHGDSTWATVTAAAIRTAVGLASANLDTQLAAKATAAKLLAYVQLLARKDAAIATDRATELGEINANQGSGAGAYAGTTDSQEAIRDRGDAAWVTGGGGGGGFDPTTDTVDGVTYAAAIKAIMAVLFGVATRSGNTVSFKARDGTTEAVSVTVHGSTAGQRTASTIA